MVSMDMLVFSILPLLTDEPQFLYFIYLYYIYTLLHIFYILNVIIYLLSLHDHALCTINLCLYYCKPSSSFSPAK